ncbi:MAG: hypothetical protein E7442_00350 [Ruminococcaceae bacterium]|nr:hypothetical protein [Oscillospiraceae bacterium]
MSITKRQKGALWNALGSTMYGANSFIMLALVSRVGTVEETGYFGIAFTTAQLLYIVGLFGVSHYQMTDYGEKYSFRSYARARFITCVFMLLCCAASIVLLGFTGIKRTYTLVLTLLMLLNVVGELFQSLFFQKNRLDLSGSALFFRTFWPLLLFCAVVLLTRSILLAVLMQTAANLLITMYYGIRVAPAFIAKPSPEKKSGDTAWNVLRECLPLAGSFLLMNVVINASKYGVEFCMDDTAQGYFNMIFMPAQVINLCCQFFCKPFLNQYAQLLAQKKRMEFSHLLKTHLLLLGGFTLLGCVAARLLGVQVLGFVYGKDLSTLEWPLTFIILGGGIFALCQLFYYILVIMRRQKAILAVYIGAGIVSAVLAFVLVSAYGIMGAVFAFVETHALILAAYFLITAAFFRRQEEI